jgi:hypothetical protein
MRHLTLMLRGLRTATAATLPLLSACDHPSAPVLHDVSVSVSEAWSGQEILVRSQGFSRAVELPRVRLDTLQLLVRRVDDTTVAASLPPTAGFHTLAVEGTSLSPFETVIRVYGFAGMSEGPRVTGYLLQYPPAGPMAFVANGDTGLVLADLQSGATQTFPSSIHAPWCMRGAGPSYNPAEVLLRTGPEPFTCGNRTQVWSLQDTPTLVDSTGLSTPRLMARLAQNAWLVSTHHMICTYGLGNPGSCLTMEETNAIRISPRADVAVPLIHYAFGAGVPVFDAASGLPRYSIRVLANAGGVAFTPDGGTLYVAGEDSVELGPAAYHVLALTPSNGALLNAVTIDSGTLRPQSWVYDVAIADPWLLVVAAGPEAMTRPVMVVLNRQTLALAAVLRTPDGLQCWNIFCGELRMLVGPSGPTIPIYVVETTGADWFRPFNARSWVYRFDLPLGPVAPTALALPN